VKELRQIACDWHIHTCLSPCAEAEMTPRRIVSAARQAGIACIAVCDHNSVENAEAVMIAGRRAGVHVIAGMEITTAEEVHIIALFPDLEAAERAQRSVYAALPGRNREDVFGRQEIVDAEDRIVGRTERFLLGATKLNLERVVELVHRVGGLAIAAHIDREGFGIVGHLGFIPPKLPLDAVELSPRGVPQHADAAFWKREPLPIVRGSDAHRLAEIGTVKFRITAAGAAFAEVRRAVRGRAGRHV
jgi:PHP family Zn ribbon phosphoesterase